MDDYINIGKKVLKMINNNGFEAYFVGEAVRNFILKREIKSEKKEQPEAAEPVMASPRRNDGFLSGLLGKFNIGGLFDCGGFFKDGHLSLGTEEILIIGIALLLLFNKSGDKECAIMLLLLLFIK